MAEDEEKQREYKSRVETRRAVRARIRRKKRRRNIIIFSIVAVSLLAFLLLNPWWPFKLTSSETSSKDAGTTSLEEGSLEAEEEDRESEDEEPEEPESGQVSSAPQASVPESTAPEETPQPQVEPRYPPVDGSLVYPFTRDGSIACGHWESGSLDYPYYGAPREGSRLHGAIDIYTTGATATDGGGMTVRAIKDGTVLEVIDNFYQRSATGERTKALLIDHGDFVACYCEIRGQPNELGTPLSLAAGDHVEGGRVIGYISGTKQLHFEMYAPGTTSRTNWYGATPPACLMDPTDFVLSLYGLK